MSCWEFLGQKIYTLMTRTPEIHATYSDWLRWVTNEKTAVCMLIFILPEIIEGIQLFLAESSDVSGGGERFKER